jgi:ATP-binding cassette subfamily C protein
VAIALRHERVMRPTIEKTAQVAPKYYAGQEGERAASEAVRALGMRSVLIDRQLERRNEFVALQTKAALVQSAYGSMSRFWRLVLQSAVLGLGAFLAVERQITPGALIAGSILAARALAPLEQVVAGLRQVEQARVAYRNLVKLIDEAPRQTTRTALPAPRGQLRFESVSVRVPEANRAALQQVSFTLEPGEVLGVIGPSGAGKSTLARAAVAAIAPDLGTVRLDGANLSDWDPDALGVHVGYLPQEVSLVGGTVAENIRRFAPASPEVDAKTIAAARGAGAHELILRLPKAYETVLGPGGRGLSLGQAQRIALARALYGDPPLLVLDEPNAHLDGEGEVALIQAVKEAAGRGAAVMLIAHKPTIIAMVNRLLLLRDGGVEAIGPRDDIARKFMRVLDSSGNLAPLRAREPQT